MAALDLKGVGGVHRLVHGLEQRGAIVLGGSGNRRSITIVGEDSRYRSLTTGKLRAMRDAIDAELRRRAI